MYAQVRPRVVWALFRWLKVHSTPYRQQGEWKSQRVQEVFGAVWNIEWSEASAVGYVELEFPTVETEVDAAEDLGPTAATQPDAPEESETSSGFAEALPGADHQRSIEQALNVARGNQPAFRVVGGQYALSEFEMYFFTMAFPELFPDGDGDFCLSRHVELRIDEWLEHLMWVGDQRCARHKIFCFVAFSKMNRERAMSQGSFFVSSRLSSVDRDGQRSEMALEDLNERVMSGDNSLARAIYHWAGNIRGSHGYMRTLSNPACCASAPPCRPPQMSHT